MAVLCSVAVDCLVAAGKLLVVVLTLTQCKGKGKGMSKESTYNQIGS